MLIELNAQLFLALGVRPSEGARLLCVTNIDFRQLLVVSLLEDYPIVLATVFDLHSR